MTAGTVSMRETAVVLSRLQRGTEEELARTFFEMYDLNSNNELSGEEIVDVYQQLLSATSHTTMTPAQKDQVRAVIKRCDVDGDGNLNFDEFLAAIREKQVKKSVTAGSIAENAFLVVVTSLFEMGTSFSLPAMGALSLGIQNRYDVGPGEVATATGIYYGGAMVGPLLFGILMDIIKSPIAIVTLANVFVVIGSLLQALAPQIWVLYVARAILGFAGVLLCATHLNTSC